MKKQFITTILVLISLLSFSQSSLRKNQISFETGLYNYGLISMSYSHNFILSKNAHLSTKCAGGAGLGFGDLNTFFGGNATINLGNKNLFFVAGVEVKSYTISVVSKHNDLGNYLYAELNTEKIHGLSVAPVLGLKNISDSGFTFAISGSLLNLKNSDRIINCRPAFGIGLGYTF